MIGKVEGLIRLYRVLASLQLKPGGARGVSHNTAYVGSCYKHVSSKSFSLSEIVNFLQN